jgi:hypothetical protein
LADSIDFETGRLVRLDRASGRSVDLAGAFDFLPGPQLSADGQHLIGVQRDGTVLHVDASSGARSTLFTADRDLAGGPLIPGLAPDGSTVVHLEQRVVRGSGPAEVHFDIVETALAEQGEPRVHAGEIITLPIAGRFGVPSSASAVALNVTATNPNADGFVTVWPCDGSQPLASNLNYIAGRTVPNATISKLAANGSVCLYTKSPTDLVVDVQGYFPATTPVVGLTPARLLDTRNGKGRPGTAKVPAGGVIQLQVGGEEGIPAGARSAVLNVTVTEPDGPGFVTVYPCGSQAPTASNLNYVSGQTVANAVVSKLDDNGAVCLVTKLAAHLVVDVDGYALASANVVGMTPTRLVDTRIGSGTATAQKMTAGSSVAVHVAGRDGLPGIIAAATLNVTATEPAADGYLTAYPCGATPPTASNVNFESGQTVPNLVIAVPDVYGDVCIYASQTTHLVVDVTGALVGSDAYVGFAPTRAIDTRHS